MDYISTLFPFYLFTTSNEDKKILDKEYLSAILIQCSYRMYKNRKEYKYKIEQIKKIQLWYRKNKNKGKNELDNTSNSIKKKCKNKKNKKKNFKNKNRRF